MKCLKCGTEHEAKFCPECGSPAQQVTHAPAQYQPPENVQQQAGQQYQQRPMQGAPPPPNKKGKGCLIAALIVAGAFVLIIILLAIIGVAAGNVKSGSTSVQSVAEESTSVKSDDVVESASVQPEPVDAPKDEEYFDGTIFQTKEFIVEITDYKVIQPGEDGNTYGDSPVIAFWYKTTNLADKELSPMNAWLFSFEAIQDNDPNAVNKLSAGMHPDGALLDNQMKNIKNGGTVENAMAYELTDDITPVVLQAKTNLFSDPIGEFAYEIK